MTIRTDRLRTLAAHLRNPKTFNDTHKFNYAQYATRKDCGTTACACGELPSIWPDEWELTYLRHCDGQFVPHRIGRHHDFAEVIVGITQAHVCEWFGIDEEMFDHLFVPQEQRDRYGWDPDHIPDKDLEEPFATGPDQVLAPEASAEAVATVIEQFCDWAEKEELS